MTIALFIFIDRHNAQSQAVELAKLKYTANQIECIVEHTPAACSLASIGDRHEN